MRDKHLLERIGLGDEAALSELYRSYQPRLVRFLGRFTNNRQVIEEAVNDTLLVIWERSSEFRGDSTPTTWIMGIGYNKMLKALKRSKPFPAPVEHPVTDLEPRSGFAMDQAVRMLPAAQAAVVVLTYEFGYSYKEISEILSCPENTVKTRMFHARKSLKRWFKEHI